MTVVRFELDKCYHSVPLSHFSRDIILRCYSSKQKKRELPVMCLCVNKQIGQNLSFDTKKLGH